MTLPISLIVIHFIADWLFQSDWMALNKSKRWDALLLHVVVYSVCFWPFTNLRFVLVTALFHFLTDAVTSRITSRLWFIPMEKVTEELWYAYPEWHKRHRFFVMIGFDQLIHYVTLALTYRFLVGA